MIVKNLNIRTESGLVRAESTLEFEGTTTFACGSRSQTLWFEWPEAYSSTSEVGWESFALGAQPLALVAGETLRVRGEIDTTFYLNLLEAVEVYHWYFPDEATRIDIECRCAPKHYSNNDRVGTFFSGGVDSLFNIADLKKLNKKTGVGKITDLWLVHGMDIELGNQSLFDQTFSTLSEMAETENLEVIPIKTNARELQESLVGWTSLGFSVILGAVAKLFSGKTGSVLIGSYDKYKYCVPHASSPLVDPLWSCGRQHVRHYSARYTRLDKLDVIANNIPEMLSGLRVCWKNTGGAYNCGRCEKCMRTLSQLYLLGVVDHVESFPHENLIDNLRSFRLNDKQIQAGYTVRFWKEIAEYAAIKGENELQNAVLPIIRHGEWRLFIANTKKKIKSVLRR